VLDAQNQPFPMDQAWLPFCQFKTGGNSSQNSAIDPD
jgi:hypothetical protein